MQEVENKVMI